MVALKDPGESGHSKIRHILNIILGIFGGVLVVILSIPVILLCILYFPIYVVKRYINKRIKDRSKW